MFCNTSVARDAERGYKPTSFVLTDEGVFWALTRFFRRRQLGFSSEIGYSLAVSRALNWTHARCPQSPGTASGNADAFGRFLSDLRHGTIRDGADPSGLWWTASTAATVRLTAQRVAEFGDWLALSGEGEAINPATRHASGAEQMLFLRNFAKSKRSTMMAHARSATKAQGRAKKAREVNAPGRRSVAIEETAAFPIEHVKSLLFEGFERKGFEDDARLWMRYNLRDMLITLICLYGGTRMSEPMHLWVDDVFESPTDPDGCKILIHDPEDGLVEFTHPVTGKSESTNRADYLERFCGGKRPLTMEAGRRRAGWKGCLLTNRERKAIEVFWIEPGAGALFRELWNIYLREARPPQENTPWAFLTKDGQPMGTAAYSDSLRAAVKKIGLSSGKWKGTTPHGLRHRYGQMLNHLQVDEKTGQVAMHHTHPGSQAAYRAPSAASVAAALADAAKIDVSLSKLAILGGSDVE